MTWTLTITNAALDQSDLQKVEYEIQHWTLLKRNISFGNKWKLGLRGDFRPPSSCLCVRPLQHDTWKCKDWHIYHIRAVWLLHWWFIFRFDLFSHTEATPDDASSPQHHLTSISPPTHTHTHTHILSQRALKPLPPSSVTQASSCSASSSSNHILWKQWGRRVSSSSNQSDRRNKHPQKKTNKAVHLKKNIKYSQCGKAGKRFCVWIIYISILCFCSCFCFNLKNELFFVKIISSSIIFNS